MSNKSMEKEPIHRYIIVEYFYKTKKFPEGPNSAYRRFIGTFEEMENFVMMEFQAICVESVDIYEDGHILYPNVTRKHLRKQGCRV